MATIDSLWFRWALLMLVALVSAMQGITLLPRSIWAMDMDGALIPLCIAAWLYFFRLRDPLRITVLVLAMAVLTSQFVFIGKDSIDVPLFSLAIGAAVLTFAVCYRDVLSSTFVVGTVGSWIGCDVMHVGAIKDGVMGGAGVSDGVFLIGPTSVLFAAMLMAWWHSDRHD